MLLPGFIVNQGPLGVYIWNHHHQRLRALQVNWEHRHTHTHTRFASSASILLAAQKQEVRLYRGDQTGNGSKNSRSQWRIPIHILTQISISPVSRFAPTHPATSHPPIHTHTLGILKQVFQFHTWTPRDLSATIDGLSPDTKGCWFHKPSGLWISSWGHAANQQHAVRMTQHFREKGWSEKSLWWKIVKGGRKGWEERRE